MSRASPSDVELGPASQAQPPPPVARPQIELSAPPVPEAPLVELDDALELDEEDALPPPPPPVPPPPKHWPFWHCWPDGQITPAQGQVPQLPVIGSQHEPPMHGFGWHLSGTQTGGVFERSQVSVFAQAGLQPGQVPLAQEGKHTGFMKSGLGLHSWSGGQLSGLQGLLTQAPLLHALSQPGQGTL